jgi:hypothetical protein
MKKLPIHILYGLTTGLVVGLLSMFFILSKTKINPSISITTSIAVIFIGVFLSSKLFVNTTGKTSGKEIFVNGFKTSAMITLVVVAIGYLTLIFFPKLKTDTISNWEKDNIEYITKDSITSMDSILKIQNNPALIVSLTDSVARKTSNYKKQIVKDKVTFEEKFNIFFLGQNILSTTILGLVASIVSIFIIQRNKK